ncbi:hypothetical protein GCM10022225_80520 [Plantactinospora mayteni]|uniref:Uncharacterized protein n=1 Tax=Plantactinospora mayteni TaxID=566021 RepID=A0ABQ4F3H3_9ACTN|nr:hypothetical protein Pma05_80380 [Plantactinospora mayteni]
MRYGDRLDLPDDRTALAAWILEGIMVADSEWHGLSQDAAGASTQPATPSAAYAEP